jgi:Cu(I)/Ag(I) efflux system membrane fusion protein/cobalt-zinc-cadmium efflux system membrane fusion protein
VEKLHAKDIQAFWESIFKKGENMNQHINNTRGAIPVRVILITAVISVSVFAAAAYFSGYLMVRPMQDSAHLHSEQKTTDSDTLYSCGMHPWIVAKEPGTCPICGMNLTPKRDQSSDAADTQENKIAYWRAPMNPTEIYDKPGKSAMGMDLVPVYENELSGGVEIKIDPVTQQNMGVRVAAAEKGPLTSTIRTYGHITYDETRKSQINPKFSGWLEKVYVDFTGQMVEKGDPLFDIYSPDLITVQEDYLEAFRNYSSNPSAANRKIRDSVMRRLSFFDISDEEIKKIEKKGTASHGLTIRSPFKGVVTQKSNAVEGAFVKEGSTIYEIADLSKVWVEAHIYEYELSMVTAGLNAEMTLPYIPGKRYHGKVAYVYPYLQRQTRDVVIRIEFENPDLELKPDMYANVFIKTTAEDEGIMVPTESVIRSGERNLLFITRGDGKFMPREVTLGMSLDNGMVQILKGVAPGETVVTSGQFLLDSESKLKEATRKMMEPQPIPKAEDPVKPADDFFDDLE